MDRSTLLALAAPVAPFLALGLVGYGVHSSHLRQIADVSSELRAVEDRLQPSGDPTSARVAALESELAALREELAHLKLASPRTPLRSPSGGRAADASAPATNPVTNEALGGGEADASSRAELDDVLARLAGVGWDFSDSADDMQRLLELGKETGVLDDAIAELEARVAESPDDLDARLKLAEYCVGKLMTVGGPEQGVWGGKAETQWKEVVARDDDVWKAHHSLGTSYSYYPTVMGKTDDAIHHLERSMELQAFQTPAPEHVKTYLFLARMYVRNEQKEEAKSALKQGLSLHPGNAQLSAELAKLGG